MGFRQARIELELRASVFRTSFEAGLHPGFLRRVRWLDRDQANPTSTETTLQALKEVESKLREFADNISQIVPGESLCRFYSITAEQPRLSPIGRERLSPLLEWTTDGFQGGNKAYALQTFCPPSAVCFRGEYPGPFEDHMDHVLNCAADGNFDEPLLLSEVAHALAMRGEGIENLVWKGRPTVQLDGMATSRKSRRRASRSRTQARTDEQRDSE